MKKPEFLDCESWDDFSEIKEHENLKTALAIFLLKQGMKLETTVKTINYTLEKFPDLFSEGIYRDCWLLYLSEPKTEKFKKLSLEN